MNNQISPYAWPISGNSIYHHITHEMVIHEVCGVLNLQPCELQAKTRQVMIVRGRYMVWAILRHLRRDDYTLLDCGLLFGSFDHTTVIHGIESLQNQIETNSTIRFEVEKVMHRLIGRIRNTPSYLNALPTVGQIMASMNC